MVFGAFVGQRDIVGAQVGRFVFGAFVGQSEIVGDQVGRVVRNATGAIDPGEGVVAVVILFYCVLSSMLYSRT